MTSNPTANQKKSRKQTDSSIMNDTTDIKRSKRTPCLPINYFSSINLMQFVEIPPLNPLIQPHARSGHRAVATESDLWIWGGYHPATMDSQAPQMFDELWRFNFALQQWTLETTTGDGPTLTPASHSMCLYRNLVFVFGGTGFPFGHSVSDQLHILDLKRRHWRRCQLLNQQPQRAYGSSLIIKDDHLYILCGTNSHNYNSNVYDIHLPTITCTQIGSTFDEQEEFFGDGRYRQEVYIYENKIFVFGGGGSSGISFSLENLPVFDLTTRTWSFIHTNPDPIHNFPSPRKFHSVLPFREKNQVIVFGGAFSNQMPNRHGPCNGNLWIFNFEKLAWSMLPSLNLLRPTYFHAADINERGEIWSHGGVVVQGPTMLESRITTVYKMHTRVLKLSELSWNYLLNCLSDRTCLIKQPHLMSQLNIPAQFSERVY